MGRMVLSERKKIYISPENAPYDFNAHKTQRISFPAGRNFLFCNVFNSVSAGTAKKFSFVFFPISPDDSADFFQSGYVIKLKTLLNALYFWRFFHRFSAIFSIKTHTLVLHFLPI